MLDDVAAAFNRKDYPTAARLLKGLLQQSPQDPWVQFYLGRLQEVSDKFSEAEKIYRQILRTTTNSKLSAQARQGIQRIEDTLSDRRQRAIAQATADPASHELGFLVLEAVAGDARASVISKFSRVMKLDAYSSRMLIPSRGWRLYRTGLIGELRVYEQELREAEVPVLSVSLTELNKIQVFQVEYFKAIAPKVVVVCRNEEDQLGAMTFEWSEVSQRVEGLLPIFEQVLDLGYRDQLLRKEKTQDYSHFCDLHLPDRRSLLRIQDSKYEFHRGVSVAQEAAIDKLGRSTVRRNWNGLIELLRHQLPQTTVWSNFTTFAETTQEFAVPLDQLKSHVDLLRQSSTFWDPAFHLYSGLIFLRKAGAKV